MNQFDKLTSSINAKTEYENHKAKYLKDYLKNNKIILTILNNTDAYNYQKSNKNSVVFKEKFEKTQNRMNCNVCSNRSNRNAGILYTFSIKIMNNMVQLYFRTGFQKNKTDKVLIFEIPI